MKKYRVHSAEFRESILREIAEGAKSISQICRENNISSGLVYRWQGRAKGGLSFSERPTAREKQLEKELEKAERKIGQMTMALDFLKKIQSEAFQRTKRSSGLIVTGKRPPGPKEEQQK